VIRLLVAVLALAAVAYGSLTLVDRYSAGTAGPVTAPVPSPAVPGSTPSAPTTLVGLPSGSVPPPTPVAPPTTAGRSPSPSSSPSTSPGSASASSGASDRPRPRLDTGLTTNTLYSVRLAAGTGVCDARIRRPEPPVPDKQLVGYLDTLVDCLDDALTPPLRTAGLALTKPKVKGYRQQISTPCGWLSPTSAPAYYCSGDNVIYVPLSGDDGDEAYTYARIGYLALVAHEYGHHLQYVSGMFGDYTSRYYKAKLTDRYALSRRLELQADCFAGVFLGYVAPSIKLSSGDRAQLREWHTYTGDEDSPGNRPPDHGTSAAQIRWLERGLTSSDYGRCNTWQAPAAAVK
jgi:predicted metalloprotease